MWIVSIKAYNVNLPKETFMHWCMRSNERSVAAYTICGWLWRVKAHKGAFWGQNKGGEKKMSMVQQSKGMDVCPRMHRKAVVRHARALWKKRQIAEANGVMQRDR